MKTPSARSPVVVDILVVALTLAAPVFGATNQLLPKACLLLGVAIVWCLSPPTRPLPWRVTALFAALALTGFFALLPRGIFPAAPWAAVLQQLGVVVPATLSLQPWLTLEKALLLTGGLTWAWYLMSRQWQLPRRALMEIYAGGVLLITFWSLLNFATGRTPTLTDGTHVFGIFPNRNQMANFTALGGLIMLALGMDGILGRSRTVVPWLAAFSVAMAGVLLTGSRAGVLMLGFGAAIWLVWMSLALNRRGWILVGAGLILLMLAAMFVYRYALVQRLTLLVSARSEDYFDFRILLHKDALPLVRAASWHGAGLGNFDSLFAQYRNSSVTPNRALHPESDWLWLIIEAGWLAPILALAAFGLVARSCWPFAAGTDRALRSAALVCCGLFVLHGFFDVSGHRIGTLWPALFLLGLSVNASWGTVRTLPKWTVIVPLLTGAIGLGLGLAAMQLVPWPSSASLAELKRESQRAIDQKDYSMALPLATKALGVAPLDWELYFARGTARALTEPATGPAAADFAIARQLEPNPLVAFEAGRVWLTRDQNYAEKSYFLGREPERAVEAWGVLLQRHPSRAVEFFDQMLDLARNYPEVLPHLYAFARDRPPLLLNYAISMNGPGFDDIVRELFAAEPGLKFASAAQLRRFFHAWARQGDPAALERTLRENPVWLEFGWMALGEVLERRGDFERACVYARSFVPRAQLPASPGGLTLAAAWASYSNRPRDIAAGIVYVQKLVETDGKPEALRVLHKLTALPEAPDYIHAFEADLAYDLREFEVAWMAWKRGAPR